MQINSKQYFSALFIKKSFLTTLLQYIPMSSWLFFIQLPLNLSYKALSNYQYKKNIIYYYDTKTMNKKTKWGIIILIGAGIIGGGIYSQLPKANDELAAADKMMGSKKNGKRILNVNAKIIKPQLLTDKFTTTGVLLPDEEVDLSFETSGKVIEINFEDRKSVV